VNHINRILTFISVNAVVSLDTAEFASANCINATKGVYVDA
jgi:hypothetical protein